MTFLQFLKDKRIVVITQVIFLIFLGTLFYVLKLDMSWIIMILVVSIIFVGFPMILEFQKKKTYYDNIFTSLSQMEKKQFIAGVIAEPEFVEGEILYDILVQTTKAMNDEIASYRKLQDEYQEYIEAWIHEIKMPISCISLLCINEKNPWTKSISEEVDRMEEYVEQALYYARSSSVEKDYMIQKIALEEFIKSICKKHAKQLISNQTTLVLENLDFIVYSDRKWLEFIIWQIIGNSIKYKKDTLELEFSARSNATQVILSIRDNGIGMIPKDVGRVFEKAFSGENGRKFAKSTGIGLYLCKKLCDKMHLTISLTSKEEVGTTVEIVFPKDKLFCF